MSISLYKSLLMYDTQSFIIIFASYLKKRN